MSHDPSCPTADCLCDENEDCMECRCTCDDPPAPAGDARAQELFDGRHDDDAESGDPEPTVTPGAQQRMTVTVSVALTLDSPNANTPATNAER